MLWFILIVNVRPLSYWDSLVANCWERAVPLFCFYFSAALIVGSLFRAMFRAGCGIRLYRFVIIAFLSTL